MEIGDIRLGSLQETMGVYKAARHEDAKRATRWEEKRDMYALSSQAQSYNAVRKALSAVPDAREDVVNELKGRLESGAYNISSQSVADKMLGILL